MMGVDAVRGINRFDIGIVHQDSKGIMLFKFNPQQTQVQAGIVHEMLNIKDFGSLEFKLKKGLACEES